MSLAHAAAAALALAAGARAQGFTPSAWRGGSAAAAPAPVAPSQFQPYGAYDPAASPFEVPAVQPAAGYEYIPAETTTTGGFLEAQQPEYDAPYEEQPTASFEFGGASDFVEFDPASLVPYTPGAASAEVNAMQAPVNYPRVRRWYCLWLCRGNMREGERARYREEAAREQRRQELRDLGTAARQAGLSYMAGLASGNYGGGGGGNFGGPLDYVPDGYDYAPMKSLTASNASAARPGRFEQPGQDGAAWEQQPVEMPAPPQPADAAAEMPFWPQPQPQPQPQPVQTEVPAGLGRPWTPSPWAAAPVDPAPAAGDPRCGRADAPEPGACRDFGIKYVHLQGECQMTLACPGVAGVFPSLRACADACDNWTAAVDPSPPAAGDFEWPERTAPLADGPRLSEGPAAAVGTDFMSELRQSYEHYDAAERAGLDGVFNTMSVRAPYGGPGGSAAAAADERCQLPIMAGPCRSRVPSFGFDAASGKCEAFDYGGCGGNANKFSSYEKCAATCTPAISFPVKPVTPPLDRTMELAVAQCRTFKAPGSPRLGVEPGPAGPLVLQITNGTPSSKVLLFVGETAGEARTPANLECPGTKVGAKFNSAYAVEIGADGTGYFVLEGIGPEERDLCQKYVIEAVDTTTCGTSFLDTRA